jgi:acyl-CoA thioesterase YciA
MTESTTQPVTGLDAEPTGDLTIRTVAMPADTNANGDIFGGWLLSQMDLGGGIFAAKVAKTRTVTVAIEAMTFRKAVHVGDVVSVHAELVRMGRTSLTVHIEAWVLRRTGGNEIPPFGLVARNMHRLSRRGPPCQTLTSSKSHRRLPASWFAIPVGTGSSPRLTVSTRWKANCFAMRAKLNALPFNSRRVSKRL